MFANNRIGEFIEVGKSIKRIVLYRFFFYKLWKENLLHSSLSSSFFFVFVLFSCSLDVSLSAGCRVDNCLSFSKASVWRFEQVYIQHTHTHGHIFVCVYVYVYTVKYFVFMFVYDQERAKSPYSEDDALDILKSDFHI